MELKPWTSGKGRTEKRDEFPFPLLYYFFPHYYTMKKGCQGSFTLTGGKVQPPNSSFHTFVMKQTKCLFWTKVRAWSQCLS